MLTGPGHWLLLKEAHSRIWPLSSEGNAPSLPAGTFPGIALSLFQECCPWIPGRRAHPLPLHILSPGSCREQQCHPSASKGDKTWTLNCSSRVCHPALHQLGSPPLDAFKDLHILFKLRGPIYGIAFPFCGGTEQECSYYSYSKLFQNVLCQHSFAVCGPLQRGKDGLKMHWIPTCFQM